MKSNYGEIENDINFQKFKLDLEEEKIKYKY